MPSLREALQTFTTVILTGGSSGIGKSFIELVAKLNPALTVCNLSRRKPETNVPQLKLSHFPCDLSVSKEISTTSERVVNFLEASVPTGRVLLINNSGFGYYGRFPEPELSHHLEMIDVNVRAVVHLTGLLLPFLKQRGGTIMTVASIAGFQPTPFMATYGATKAFVLNWSLALHEELRGTGVTTLAVCPGPTPTNFSERAGLRQGSVTTSLSTSCEVVVNASLRALAAGRRQVTPGLGNKLAVFSSALVTKPMAARVSARVLRPYLKKKRENP